MSAGKSPSNAAVDEQDKLGRQKDHRVSPHSKSRSAAQLHTPNWIQLTEGKEFSRLLYTNPVCFLGTSNQQHSIGGGVTGPNVMVLSWLTATNNEGSFMFSLNKNRYTASVLRDEFTLSVPVQGMEDLVLNVGGVSRKWGISKFSSEHHDDYDDDGEAVDEPPSTENLTQKKRKTPRFPRGIPCLDIVPLGHNGPPQHQSEPNIRETTDTNQQPSTTWPFAIKGTVAHLLCKVIHKADEAAWVDAFHYVIFAKVTKAHVHASYWNDSKKLFEPKHGHPPYLTFFGSQTFGYVSPSPLSTPTAMNDA